MVVMGGHGIVHAIRTGSRAIAKINFFGCLPGRPDQKEDLRVELRIVQVAVAGAWGRRDWDWVWNIDEKRAAWVDRSPSLDPVVQADPEGRIQNWWFA
jgi:hypothetical protein